jgi:hypothetical protein
MTGICHWHCTKSVIKGWMSRWTLEEGGELAVDEGRDDSHCNGGQLRWVFLIDSTVFFFLDTVRVTLWSFFRDKCIITSQIGSQLPLLRAVARVLVALEMYFSFLKQPMRSSREGRPNGTSTPAREPRQTQQVDYNLSRTVSNSSVSHIRIHKI